MRKLAVVALLLATGSHAGEPARTTFAIPYPNGTRMEIRSQAQYRAENVNGHEMRVEIAAEHFHAKAKARWAWAGQTCYADGGLAQVLADIGRCAARAINLK